MTLSTDSLIPNARGYAKHHSTDRQRLEGLLGSRVSSTSFPVFFFLVGDRAVLKLPWASFLFVRPRQSGLTPKMHKESSRPDVNVYETQLLVGSRPRFFFFSERPQSVLLPFASVLTLILLLQHPSPPPLRNEEGRSSQTKLTGYMRAGGRQ